MRQVGAHASVISGPTIKRVGRLRQMLRASFLVMLAAAAIGSLACSRETGAPVPDAAPLPAPSTPPSDASAGGLGLRLGGDLPLRLSDGGTLTGKAHAEVPLVTTTGAVDHDDVERILRINQGRYRLCYSKVLYANASLTGDAKVSFSIDPTGSVIRARDAGSTITSPPLIECLVRSVEHLSFTPPEAGTAEVIVSVRFSVESD